MMMKRNMKIYSFEIKILIKIMKEIKKIRLKKIMI